MKRQVVSAGLCVLLFVAVSCDGDPARPRQTHSPTTASSATPSISPSAQSTPAYRAFSKSSYWNTPLPANAPVDPNSSRIIKFLMRDNKASYVTFPGTRPGDKWGTPVYWATKGDPTYQISNRCEAKMPPEFGSIRIPNGARPNATSDSAFTLYDLDKGLVYGFFRARYDAGSDAWSACGGTVYYLDSNGLAGDLAQSNESRNTGHRGLPPPIYTVQLSEIQSGELRRVLELRVNNAALAHVFPLSGHEHHGTNSPDAPPEGARLRIKPSVDLTKLHLSPAAMVIARALQTYGAIIGDQTGGPLNLNIENTRAEGRGQLWAGVLSYRALSSIPLDLFEVIKLGYRG